MSTQEEIDNLNQEIERLRQGIERLSTREAFDLPTAHASEEVNLRIEFAENLLNGKHESEWKKRYERQQEIIQMWKLGDDKEYRRDAFNEIALYLNSALLDTRNGKGSLRDRVKKIVDEMQKLIDSSSQKTKYVANFKFTESDPLHRAAPILKMPKY